MKLTFYTVKYHQRGYPVHYLDPEHHEKHIWRGPSGKGFSDPVEAMGEFEACIGGQGSCYLEAAVFAGKIAAFSRQKKQLAAWNAMSAKV